jgi:hypothetical protein
VPKPERDMFKQAEEYERGHPGVAEAMRLFGVSMEQYESSLSALYTPTVVTSGSTEDLNARLE